MVTCPVPTLGTAQATEPAPQQQVAPPTQQQNGHDPALELGAAASRPAARLPPLQPAVRLQLHYRSSWLQPILHHSLRGGEWSSAAMQPVVSGGGWWKAANLHVDAGAAHGGGVGAPLLEFVLTDGQGAWDKAPDSENYAIAEPGAWALRDGQLARVATPPVLLVSDLDDTMIGDDDATAAFTAWWREEGVPAGGRLVYNTGAGLQWQGVVPSLQRTGPACRGRAPGPASRRLSPPVPPCVPRRARAGPV